LTRALLLATTVVALVALVAVAAGGYRLGGSGSTKASPYAVDVILTVVIALYLLASVGVVAMMFWSGLELRRIPRRQTKRERTFRTAVILVCMAILFVIAVNRFHWRVHTHPPTLQTPAATGSGAAGKHAKGGHSQTTHQAHLRLVPFFAVLGAGGVAFAAFLIAERRRRRRLPKNRAAAEVLSDVLDETLDDLRAEPDPRRAVIAAYARMERSLAAHGIPRRRFEAPNEYLQRVLSEVSGGRLAATRLTALFERARFSPHEVDESMKASAIDAIESLQADLAAAELVEAAA
jgi:TRAP-type C4-dicarboxylate transport system permease small subunit